RIGVPRADRLRQLRHGNPLPIAQLFACERYRCLDSQFYATSWAVVSLLLATHRDSFLYYLQRLNEVARGRLQVPWHMAFRDLPDATRRRRVQETSAARANAWRDAFPGLSSEALDRELWRWIVAGEHLLPSVELSVDSAPLAERTLGD